MSRGISAYLRDAIDCYISDPGLAWLHLEMTQEQIRAEKDAKAADAERDALKLSFEKTKAAFRDRLLEFDERPAKDNELPVSARLEFAHPAESYQSFREQQARIDFEHLLSVLTWKQNQDRARTDPEISREQVLEAWGREMVLSVRGCSDWDLIEREFELAMMAQPDFELYLVRKHLDWAEQTSAKVEEDGPIAFRDSIPPHLKLYFYEASWCDLLGLEAACVSLCGGILQEAIRIKLNAKGFTGLFEAIEEATRGDLPLLTGKAQKAADEIKTMRNTAVHGKLGFGKFDQYQRKYALSLTRELLDTIFANES